MVGRNTARNQVEALVIEAKCVCIGFCERHVLDAPIDSKLLGDREHFRRHIGGDDRGDVWRNGKGHVASCGGDVERVPVRL